MKCKKLTFQSSGNPTILYGIIIKESKLFFTFKTAKKEHIVSKNCILAIEDTTMEFKEEI